MNILDHMHFQNPWFRDYGYRPREQSLFPRSLFARFFDHVINTKQITSLMGIRRVGKSTLIKQVIGQLLSKNISPDRILYFSFDQPTILHETETLESVIMIYLRNVIGLSIHEVSQTLYLFFDEVQLIPYWQDIVKRFYDINPHLKFVISGSASLFLLTKSKESLAGRIFEFLLPPLTFAEYQKLSGKNDIGEFLDFGQFPELLELTDIERKKEYLKEIVRKVLEVDIVETYGVRKVFDFERLFWSLLPNSGQVIVSSRLATDIGLKKATLFHYLKILESSLLINKVLNLSGSFRSESRLLRKLYPGSANFLTLTIDPVSIGFKAETYIASVLTTFGKVYFFHQRGREIDFLLPDKKLAIEVKYQEHIRKEDYAYLVNFSEKKKYKTLMITKSFNSDFSKDIPQCVSVDKLEEYLRNKFN